MRKALIVLFALTLALTFAFLASYTPAQAKKDQIKLKTFVHYPNPGRPSIGPTCTETTSNPNDYLPADWHMPTSGLNYQINLSSKPKNLADSDVSSAITNSFATWTAADSKQIFTPVGSTNVKSAKYDGTNAVLWKGINGGAIAITYIWYYPGGDVVEVDTAFNKNLKWTVNDPSGDCIASATYDVQNIGTHEFGHWIGLADLYATKDKDLTMYGYGDTGELKKDSLGAGDITGVLAIAP